MNRISSFLFEIFEDYSDGLIHIYIYIRHRPNKRVIIESRPYLPVAQYHPFLAGQTVQTDGAAHMDFIGRNTDFRPQPVFKSVGKTGAGIHHDAGTVDHTQENPGIGIRFGNDTVCMVAAVFIDVRDVNCP